MVLTPAQHEPLSTFLATAFDEGALERMVKFRLFKDLYTLVARGKTTQVAFDLIRVAEQEGWTESLVQAMYFERSGRSDIRDFVEANWPDMKASRDAREQVSVVKDSLASLQDRVRQLSTLSARVMESRLRRDLQTISQQIETLKDHNALVGQLVDLSTRHLRALSEAAARQRASEPGGTLQAAVQQLQAEVERLRATARRLRSYRVEKDWIDSLEQAAAFMLKGLARPDDAPLQSGLATFQRVVLEEPPRVTTRLFDAAGNLDLRWLCDAISELCDGLSGIASETSVPFPVKDLQAEVRSLLLLEPRLSGLVKEYFEWQWVDKECAMADNLRGRAPAERFRWELFYERVRGLCQGGNGRLWASTLAGSLEELQQAYAGDAAQFDDRYNRFRGMVVSHFLSLGGQLYDLIEQLAQMASPLAQLLASFTPDSNGLRTVSNARG
jgi:hypothetical protein